MKDFKDFNGAYILEIHRCLDLLNKEEIFELIKGTDSKKPFIIQLFNDKLYCRNLPTDSSGNISSNFKELGMFFINNNSFNEQGKMEGLKFNNIEDLKTLCKIEGPQRA